LRESYKDAGSFNWLLSPHRLIDEQVFRTMGNGSVLSLALKAPTPEVGLKQALKVTPLIAPTVSFAKN